MFSLLSVSPTPPIKTPFRDILLDNLGEHSDKETKKL